MKHINKIIKQRNKESGLQLATARPGLYGDGIESQIIQAVYGKTDEKVTDRFLMKRLFATSGEIPALNVIHRSTRRLASDSLILTAEGQFGIEYRPFPGLTARFRFNVGLIDRILEIMAGSSKWGVTARSMRAWLSKEATGRLRLAVIESYFIHMADEGIIDFDPAESIAKLKQG